MFISIDLIYIIVSITNNCYSIYKLKIKHTTNSAQTLSLLLLYHLLRKYIREFILTIFIKFTYTHIPTDSSHLILNHFEQTIKFKNHLLYLTTCLKHSINASFHCEFYVYFILLTACVLFLIVVLTFFEVTLWF